MLSVISAVLLALCITGTAFGERRIVVNGERLNNGQIQSLEQIHCGPIRNGNYWLDMNTGIWGFAGYPTPMGNITDNCYDPEPRPSMSERGILFSPRDWLN